MAARRKCSRPLLYSSNNVRLALRPLTLRSLKQHTRTSRENEIAAGPAEPARPQHKIAASLREKFFVHLAPLRRCGKPPHRPHRREKPSPNKKPSAIAEGFLMG